MSLTRFLPFRNKNTFHFVEGNHGIKMKLDWAGVLPTPLWNILPSYVNCHGLGITTKVFQVCCSRDLQYIIWQFHVGSGFDRIIELESNVFSLISYLVQDLLKTWIDSASSYPSYSFISERTYSIVSFSGSSS